MVKIGDKILYLQDNKKLNLVVEDIDTRGNCIVKLYGSNIIIKNPKVVKIYKDPTKILRGIFKYNKFFKIKEIDDKKNIITYDNVIFKPFKRFCFKYGSQESSKIRKQVSKKIHDLIEPNDRIVRQIKINHNIKNVNQGNYIVSTLNKNNKISGFWDIVDKEFYKSYIHFQKTGKILIKSKKLRDLIAYS